VSSKMPTKLQKVVPMSFSKLSLRQLGVLCVAGCLLAIVPAATFAQTNPGITFSWGGNGPTGKQQLGYVLDYGTPGHPQDRYRLKVGSQKTAIDGIRIAYPSYYDGEFNEKQITLQESQKSKLFGLGKAKKIPVSSVQVDKDNRLIEIVPETAIPAGTPVEVVLSDVRNPRSGGTYYFSCYISVPGDIPLKRYLGTWVLSIFRS
jgi:Protein of unknown function (DUF2808)